MKKYILVCLIALISLTGCTVSEGDKKSENYRFSFTGNEYYINSYTWMEVVDTKTGNLYLSKNGEYASGLCPLYDENGEIDNINK